MFAAPFRSILCDLSHGIPGCRSKSEVPGYLSPVPLASALLCPLLVCHPSTAALVTGYGWTSTTQQSSMTTSFGLSLLCVGLFSILRTTSWNIRNRALIYKYECKRKFCTAGKIRRNYTQWTYWRTLILMGGWVGDKLQFSSLASDQEVFQVK